MTRGFNTNRLLTLHLHTTCQAMEIEALLTYICTTASETASLQLQAKYHNIKPYTLPGNKRITSPTQVSYSKYCHLVP